MLEGGKESEDDPVFCEVGEMVWCVCEGLVGCVGGECKGKPGAVWSKPCATKKREDGPEEVGDEREQHVLT